MRKKIVPMSDSEKAKAEVISEITEYIKTHPAKTPHNSDCIFHDDGMCILLKKACISVPGLMCTSAQLAVEIGSVIQKK